MKLEKARKIANRVVQTLSPHTETISIAGSVRRQKSEVKDIEIVCLPEIEVEEVGIFRDKYETRSRYFIGQAGLLGRAIKGSPAGRYMQIELPEGINLDLFMPLAHDYYRQLVIRTGSAEWVRKYIASGWVKKGWVGTPGGLRLRNECSKVSNKSVCVEVNPELPPAWKSEEEFFQWIGLPWTDPRDREI